MIGIALAVVAVATAGLSEARVFDTKEELQSALDAILDRCDARPNLTARALSERLANVSFANPPADIFKDRALKCVMREGAQLRGVTFGIVGSEQYIDSEGNRR